MRGRKLNDVLTSNSLQRRVKDAKNADTRVKYCIECRRCWEIIIINNFTKKSREIRHYEDFPSYGKVKEKCDKCKGERNGKNVIDKPLV